MSIQSLIPKYICDIAPYQGGKPIAELAREYQLEESSIVKLASNENPLGMSPKAREVILKSIDEIYRYPDGNAYKSVSFSWLSQFPNLIISRTFSKAYGLAGLRVGFGASNPEIIQFMNRVRQPFNVNSLAQDAAVAALMDDAFVSESKILNNNGKKQLESALQRLKLSFIPTFGNFISFKVDKAFQVYEALLKAGIIVRPVANYEMPDYLRVSIGLKEENERFIQALEAII